MVEDEEIDKNINNNHSADDNENSIATILRTYRPSDLKKWRTVPPVSENYGAPGEMGKPVRIPSNQASLAKEKFKENQFNLLASDMIWLNRSLSDVRHEK